METSKKLLLVSWIAAIVLTAAVTAGTFAGVDMSNLTTLAAAAWAEVTATHAFYLWKSKNENRSKHAMQLVRDLAGQYGIENVVNLTNTILKD